MGLPTAPPSTGEQNSEATAHNAASAEPAAGESERSDAAGPRPEAFSVLGVPRSAPPPPGGGQPAGAPPQPEPGGSEPPTEPEAEGREPPPEGSDSDETDRTDSPSDGSAGASPSGPSEAVHGQTPATPIEHGADTDQLPVFEEATTDPVARVPEGDSAQRGEAIADDEVFAERSSAPGTEPAPIPQQPPPRPSRPPPGAGAYSMSGGDLVDVVGPERKRRTGKSSAPSPSEPPGVIHGRESRNPKGTPGSDPRREPGQEPPASETVRVREQSPSAAPRQPDRSGQPQRRRGEASDEPSIIVDMGDTVEELVRNLSLCGPDDEGPSVQALLQMGEASLPVLTQRFPGPLWFDRHQPHRRLPRGRDVSALARAFVAFGEQAVPYISTILSSGHADTRFYATLLASEFIRPELVRPLSHRIFDEDAGVRALVLDVLRLFRRSSHEYGKMLEWLRKEARVPRQPTERRCTALRALGELRDVKALDLLAEMLKQEDPHVVEAAHRSLVVLTRQDFGDSPRRWLGWIERNQGRHRIEWLIDALLHPEHENRAAAGEELKHLTQQYYGFHPSMPKRDREIAQRKYREWWEREGKSQFSAPPRSPSAN
jgi:hypothetical protein